MGRTTMADLLAAVQAVGARVDALEATAGRAAVSAPAAPAVETHIGQSGKPDGRIHPCTAVPPCTRTLRSEKRAAIHGVEAGGHEPR